MCHWLLPAAVSGWIFISLTLCPLLLRSRAPPLVTIYIYIFINRLISAKFEVAFSNFLAGHYVFNLYF